MHNDALLVQILMFSLLGACLWVLAPFWSALFWAAVLAFASWPVMRLLTKVLKGRATVAALILTSGWVLLVAIPLAGLVLNLANQVHHIEVFARALQNNGLPAPPSWIATVPMIGDWLNNAWLNIDQQGAALFASIRPYLGALANWLLARSAQIGGGLLEVILSLILVFFFYRDGPKLATIFEQALKRLIGVRATHYRELIAGTVQRVVNGVIGTAAAQAILALIGFMIAGVPGAAVLAILTFCLSLIPLGPPLLWLPVSIWLIYEAEYGLAIFMLLWGTFIISGVDNFLKPYLISRGGNLPLIVVLLGVFGGLFAFGLIGLFLGPVLLVLGFSLIQDWMARKVITPTKDHSPTNTP